MGNIFEQFQEQSTGSCFKQFLRTVPKFVSKSIIMIFMEKLLEYQFKIAKRIHVNTLPKFRTDILNTKQHTMQMTSLFELRFASPLH